MTMTTVHALNAAVAAVPWSGIDAGRRQQNENTFTRFRHFRRSRRTVKRPAPETGRTALWDSAHAGPVRLELRGNHAYLRELRRQEMEAWQKSGGDVYRPAAPDTLSPQGPGTPASETLSSPQ
jgi:hypothetical protein